MSIGNFDKVGFVNQRFTRACKAVDISSSDFSEQRKATISLMDTEVFSESGAKDTTPEPFTLAAPQSELTDGYVTCYPFNDERFTEVAEADRNFSIPFLPPTVRYPEAEPLINFENNRCPRCEELAHILRYQNHANRTVEQPINWRKCYTDCSEYLTGSPYMLPAYILLFALSYLSIYMGIAYWNKCIYKKIVPTLLIPMGLGCMIALLSKTMKVTMKTLGKTDSLFIVGLHFIDYGGRIGCIFAYLYEVWELNYGSNNHIRNPGPRSCDPVFYSFVHCFNWVVSTVLIILSFLCFPCCHSTHMEN